MNPTPLSSQPAIAPAPATHTAAQAARRQIRGSSLLLIGRFLSKGVNFATQVLLVRYLARSDYGAFAYALAIATMAKTIITFGMDRAITRFVPIYHEQEDYSRLFGTLALALSTIIGLGIGTVLLFHGLQQEIAGRFINDQQALTLLLILIYLSPIEAADTLLNGLFAVFSRPQAIFFRKYVLGPALKLSIVLLLILQHSDVYFLAYGTVTIGALAVIIYAGLLVQVLRQQHLFTHFRRHPLRFPVRDVLSFTIPLLTTDLVYSVMNTLNIVLLEHWHGTHGVAALRAVQPTAKMNQLVLFSFTLLYTTAAARMFAHNDRKSIQNLYWQNAIWVAVLTFPIFALTFSLAHPLTLTLYGTRYADSAAILALLALGYYFHAALGPNGTTLMIFGRVRYIVLLNVMAACTNVAVNLLLIPRYGALGAAIGTCGTLIAHNLLKQTGLALSLGIPAFDRRYLKGYASIVLASGTLLAVQMIATPPAYLSFGLACLASWGVLRSNRDQLDLHDTLPQRLQGSFIRRLLGSGQQQRG